MPRESMWQRQVVEGCNEGVITQSWVPFHTPPVDISFCKLNQGACNLSSAKRDHASMSHVTVKKKDEFMTLRRANTGHLFTGLLQCEFLFVLLKILQTACLSQENLHRCIIDTSSVIPCREYGSITADAYYMAYPPRDGATFAFPCQIKSLA